MFKVTINKLDTTLPVKKGGRSSFLPYLEKANRMRHENCITLTFEYQPSCNTFYCGLLTTRRRYPQYSHIKVTMRDKQVIVYKPLERA